MEFGYLFFVCERWFVRAGCDWVGREGMEGGGFDDGDGVK